MGDPIRLLDGHLVIDPALVPHGDTTFASADALQSASDASVNPDPLDLFASRPRFSFRTYGTAASSMPLQVGLALPDALTARPNESGLDSAARIAANPAFDRGPRAIARGGFELSHTTPPTPEGVSTTVTARADVAAEADATSLRNVIDSARPLLAEATTLERTARDLVRREQELMQLLNGPDMRRLQEVLRRGVSPENAAAIAEAAGPLLEQLNTALAFLNDSQRFLNRVDTLISQARELESSYTARVGVRGAFELDYSFRQRVLHMRRGTTTVDVTLGATVGLMTPLGNPASTPELPGLRPLRTAMVTMQAIATVHFRGVEELAGSLRDLSTLASDASRLGRSVRGNPLALLDRDRAAATQRQVEELQTRAREVSDRVNATVDDVGVTVEAGMRTIEGTGVGGGLRDLGASLDVTHGDFDLNLAVTLRNLVGYLPGHYTDYALAEAPDGSLGLRVSDEGDRNVFSWFYPASVAVDGRLRWRASDRLSFEVRGGLRASLGSGAGSGAAYASFLSRIHDFYIGVGLMFPTGVPGVEPVLSATTGVQSRDWTFGLSAGANPSVLSGANPLSSGMFQLSLTHRF